MKTIGMTGSQLIHTYAYAMHFNSFDLEFALQAKTAPAWQVALMENEPNIEPVNEDTKITHVWGGLEGVPEDMAATFGLTVAESLEEVLEQCDLIMVMDEQIPSRTKLIRKAIEAGRDVFVDKLLSDNLTTTVELLELAKHQGVRVGAWSQMGYCPEFDIIKQMEQGGVAFAHFGMSTDIIKMYGIHIVSSIQGCFPGKFKKFIKLAGEEQVLGFVENEHGTKIILGVGEMYPALSPQINYSVNGESVWAKGADRGTAFRRAAKEIAGITRGIEPAFSPEDLKNAASLIEQMCK